MKLNIQDSRHPDATKALLLKLSKAGAPKPTTKAFVVWLQANPKWQAEVNKWEKTEQAVLHAEQVVNKFLGGK